MFHQNQIAMIRIEENQLVIVIADNQPEDFLHDFHSAVRRVTAIAIAKPDELHPADVKALQTLLLSLDEFRPARSGAA